MATERPHTYNFYIHTDEEDYAGTFIGAAVYDGISEHHALPDIDEQHYSLVRADFEYGGLTTNEAINLDRAGWRGSCAFCGGRGGAGVIYGRELI